MNHTTIDGAKKVSCLRSPCLVSLGLTKVHFGSRHGFLPSVRQQEFSFLGRGRGMLFFFMVASVGICNVFGRIGVEQLERIVLSCVSHRFTVEGHPTMSRKALHRLMHSQVKFDRIAHAAQGAIERKRAPKTGSRKNRQPKERQIAHSQYDLDSSLHLHEGSFLMLVLSRLQALQHCGQRMDAQNNGQPAKPQAHARREAVL